MIEPDAPAHRRLSATELRRTAVSGGIGTALEYYDFAMYGLAATLVFNRLFFPDSSPAVGLLASFATYAVGFFARPVGGVLLGWLGDRIGRKRVLVLTVGMMGQATTAIGLLPDHRTIGLWAPALLVALRVVQGFGAGAELAGASTLLTESAPPRRRGILASFVCTGTTTGTLVASATWLLVTQLPDEQLLSWGWRIPFLTSVVVALWALQLRRNLTESPTFESVEGEQKRLSMTALYGDLLRTGRRNLLGCFGLRIGEAGTSIVYQVFLVGYAASVAGASKSVGTLALVACSLCGFLTIPAVGALSDRFGRRIVFRVLAGWQLVFAVPGILLIQTGQTGLVVLAFIGGNSIGALGMYSVESSYFPEIFGSRYRYAAIATAKEFGGIVGGGVAPFVCAALVAATGHWWALAAYVAVLAGISFVSTFLTPESLGRDLVTQSDAGAAYAAPRPLDGRTSQRPG